MAKIYDIPKLRPITTPVRALDPAAWALDCPAEYGELSDPDEQKETFQPPEEVERDAANALLALEILRASDAVIGYMPLGTAAAVSHAIHELDKLFTGPAAPIEEKPF